MGSSASMMVGSFTKALAKATLCCCPPDNCSGKWSILSSKPTNFNNEIALFSNSSPFLPARSKAISTFSLAVSSGIKRKS